MSVLRSTPKESKLKSLWETPSRSALDVGISPVIPITISTKFNFRTVYSYSNFAPHSDPIPTTSEFNIEKWFPGFTQGGSDLGYWKSADLGSRLDLLTGIEATGDLFTNTPFDNQGPLGFAIDYYPPPDTITGSGTISGTFRNRINVSLPYVVNVAEQTILTSPQGFILRPYLGSATASNPTGQHIDVDTGKNFLYTNDVFLPAQSSYSITVKSMIYAQPGTWVINNTILTQYTNYATLPGVTSKWYFTPANSTVKTLLLTMVGNVITPSSAVTPFVYLTSGSGIFYSNGYTFPVPDPGGFFSVDVTNITVIPPTSAPADWIWNFFGHGNTNEYSFVGGPINNNIPGMYYDGDYFGSLRGSEPIWVPFESYFPMNFTYFT